MWWLNSHTLLTVIYGIDSDGQIDDESYEAAAFNNAAAAAQNGRLPLQLHLQHWKHLWWPRRGWLRSYMGQLALS